MAITTIGGREVPSHGRTFVGTVKADRMMNTVTIEWDRRRFVPKYQRYEKRRSRIKAHNPPEMHARTGDIVRVVETRPISKTKNFVVAEIITRADGSVVDEQKKQPAKKAASKKAVKKAAKKAAKKSEE